MESAKSLDLRKQTNHLEHILLQSDVVKEVLKLAPKLEMPNWYLGAGCIAQTVWNFQHGFDLTKGIKDCDLVYFDASNISSEAQERHIQHGKEVFKNISLPVEIVNEARVHLWYEEEFGQKISPYKSAEEAISEWPTTATGVAVRYDKSDIFTVFAPYGLSDLFGLILRPNKLKITKDIYSAKTERWTKIWPKLKVIPWD